MRLTISALFLLCAACRSADTRRTVVSDSAGGLRVDPATVPGAATLELWQLRPGITLGDWKGAHPDETITGTDTSAVSTQLGEWCAAAQRTTPLGNRILTRSAFFYTPSPDSSLALRDSTGVDLVKDCRLGLIWVRAEVADSSTAARVSDSLLSQLTQAYGPAVTQPIHFYGSAMWTRAARYRKGDVTAVLGLRAGGPGRTAPPAIITFAFLPWSGLSLDGEGAGRYAPRDTVALDSAATIAHLDSALYAPLRALASASFADTAPVSRDPRGLIAPLQRWLQASAGLPLPRRAAALYVADRVLDHAMCGFGICDPAQVAPRASLEGMGARFVRSDGYVSLHAWMDQARVIDRDSPLGQRIFLFQMASGFDPSGTCAAGSEGFRRVIQNGEHYLERVPASPIAAEVHFEVGEAYRDIVALARGAAGDYADSSRYGAEAGEAARKALEHYRAAMRAGAGSPAAQAAWRRAWWLKAGLAPRDVRFYCIND